MKTIFTAIYLIIFIQISPTFAQIKSKWTGQISLGSAFYKGSVNNFEVNSRGSVIHTDSAFEYSSTYKLIYGETDHKKTNQEYYADLKLDLRPKSIFSPFFLTSIRQNRYRGYELVFSIFGGIKYSFIKKPSSDISLSAAIMYDIEKYSQPFDISIEKKPTKEKVRMSIRPKIKQKIGPSLYVENITFFKPNLNDFGDYVIDSHTAITNKLSPKLFLNLLYDYEFNNKPPQQNLVKENMSFSVSLAYRFN